MSIRLMIRNRLLKWFGGMGYLQTGVKCNHKWYGGEYSGFFLNPDLLSQNSIVYSLGIGEDISFDKEVIQQFGCKVYGFDPTPKTINWLKKIKTPQNFHFLPIGIASSTGQMDFYLPKNPDFVSGSAYLHSDVNKDIKISVPMTTLTDIMSQLGHRHIDVLKMDIEGAEYAVLDHILEAGIPVRQLLVEFHSRFFRDGREKTKSAVRKLREKGYEIFAVSDLLQEVSFIRKDQD